MDPWKRRYFCYMLFISLLFVSVSVAKSTVSTPVCSDLSCPLTTKPHMSIQEGKTKSGEEGVKEMASRKYLMRRLIGSSPPQCVSKCEGCTPCEPVLVPVQPRMSARPNEIEYYPEVWGCKCRDKRYMP